MKLKRRSGDLLYLQTSLRNLAAVLRCLGAPDAEPVAAEFMELADRYSLRRSRAYLPALTAFLLVAAGRRVEARAFRTEAIDLFGHLHDEAMLSKLSDLSTVGYDRVP